MSNVTLADYQGIETSTWCAGCGDFPGKIPGPVTDKRGSFLAQGGHHHFTHITVLYRGEGIRVQNLKDIYIRPVVDAFVLRTVKPCAGTVKFRHARDVEHVFQSQKILYFSPHGRTAAFRTQDDLF